MATATAAPASSPLLSPAYMKDPNAVTDELRRSDPVHWVPELGFWLVTRYDDVRRLFTDPDCTPDSHAWEHYESPRPGSWRAKNESGGEA